MNPAAQLLFDQHTKQWLAERVCELEDRLERLWAYATHRPDCVQCTGPYDLGELEPPCNCGLDALEGGE